MQPSQPGGRKKRTDYRSRIIESPMQAEGASSILDGRNVADHRVSRRGAETFPGFVQQSSYEDQRPHRRYRNDRSRDAGNEVSADYQRLPS